MIGNVTAMSDEIRFP